MQKVSVYPQPLYVMRLQATEFSEITRGNGHYAVITPFKVIQGH